MRRLFLFLSLFIFSSYLNATPPRIEAIDNGSGLVGDDWDLRDYPHLAPHYANRFFVYDNQSRDLYAWAAVFLPFHSAATFWMNQPATTAPLFRGMIQAGGQGYTLGNLDQSQGTASVWAPRETLVALPGTQYSIGYAYLPTRQITLGFMTQVAVSSLQESRQASPGSVEGASEATYIQAYYSAQSVSVTAHQNSQNSSSLVLGPSLGFEGELFNLDLSSTMAWARIDNRHEEDLLPTATLASGHVTQALQDTGNASWQMKGRVRTQVQGSDLVAVSTLGSEELSTRHHVSGSFTGTGFVPPAGPDYSHDDKTESFSRKSFVNWLGVVRKSGSSIVTAGLGLDNSTQNLLDASYAPLSGATSLDQQVKVTETARTLSTHLMPIMAGGEFGLNSWLKARAMVQRNLAGSVTDETLTTSFSYADGSRLGEARQNNKDAAPQGWLFRVGAGATWGDFLVDVQAELTALNATLTSPAVSAAAAFKW